MPEFGTDRLTRRLPAEADAADVSLAPQARPVDLYVTPKDTNLVKLAKSLESINTNLQPFIKAREKEAQEREVMEGMAARSRMGQTDEATQVRGHNSQEGYWRQKGYMAMSGQLQAFKDISKMEQMVNQYDLAGMSSEELEGRLQGMTQQFTYGADEPDFLEGYLDKVEAFKNQVRRKHGEAHGEAQRETIRQATFGNIQQTLGETADADPWERADAINALREQGRFMGLSYQELDELEYRAVLFRADQMNDPKAFETFYVPRPDGTPGLISNPKYANHILNAEEQLKNKLERVTAETKAAIQFQTIEGFRRNLLAAKQTGTGLNVAELETELVGKIAKEQITGGAANQIMDEAYRHNMELEEMSGLKVRLANFEQIPRDKEGKKAWDAHLRTLDPIGQLSAIVKMNWLPDDMVANFNNVIGMTTDKDGNLPPSLDNAIKSVSHILSMDGGEQVLRGALNSVASGMLIDAAEQYNGSGGQMTPAQAWAVAQAYNDPKAKEAAKGIDWKTVNDLLDSADKSSSWIGGDPITDPVARVYIKKDIEASYVKSGNLEKSVEWATKRFMSTHQKGAGGVWIPIPAGGRPLTEDELGSLTNGARAAAYLVHGVGPKDHLGVDSFSDEDVMYVPSGRTPGEVSVVVGGRALPGYYDTRQLALMGMAWQSEALTPEIRLEYLEWRDRAFGTEINGIRQLAVGDDYTMADYRRDEKKAEDFAELGLFSNTTWFNKQIGLSNLKGKAEINERRIRAERKEEINNRLQQRVDERNGMKFNKPEEFVATMLPHAAKAAEKLGLPPQVLIAQAALETGWGKKIMSGLNVFGIKADAGWKGNYTTQNTHEVYNGQAVPEKAKFRAYGSYGEAFENYVEFLEQNPRYAKAIALAKAGDVAGYIQAIKDAGYATDPKYADKWASIVNKLTTG